MRRLRLTRPAGRDGARPGATVTLDPPRLTLPEGAALDAEAINRKLAELGDYRAKGPLAQG